MSLLKLAEDMVWVFKSQKNVSFVAAQEHRSQG